MVVGENYIIRVWFCAYVCCDFGEWFAGFGGIPAGDLSSTMSSVDEFL